MESKKTRGGIVRGETSQREGLILSEEGRGKKL